MLVPSVVWERFFGVLGKPGHNGCGVRCEPSGVNAGAEMGTARVCPQSHVCPAAGTPSVSSPSPHTAAQGCKSPPKPPKWVGALHQRAVPVPKATAGTATLLLSSGAGRSSGTAALGCSISEEEEAAVFLRRFHEKEEGGGGEPQP